MKPSLQSPLRSLLDDLAVYKGPRCSLLINVFESDGFQDRTFYDAQQKCSLFKEHTDTTELRHLEFRPVADTYVKQDLMARLKKVYGIIPKKKETAMLNRIVACANNDREQGRILLDHVMMSGSSFTEDDRKSVLKDSMMGIFQTTGRILAGKRAPYPSPQIREEANSLSRHLIAYRRRNEKFLAEDTVSNWRLRMTPWKFPDRLSASCSLADEQCRTADGCLRALDLPTVLDVEGEHLAELSEPLIRSPAYFSFHQLVGSLDVASGRHLAVLLHQNIPRRFSNIEDIAVAFQEISDLESAKALNESDILVAQCRQIYGAITCAPKGDKSFSDFHLEASLSRKIREDRITLQQESLLKWAEVDRCSCVSVMTDLQQYAQDPNLYLECAFDDLEDFQNEDIEEIED